MELPTSLPMIPIRNAVVFPGTSMPLVVGRPRSMGALKKAQERQSLIVITTQRVMSASEPEPTDLYRVGTLCRIDNIIGTETGGYQVVVTGISRYRIEEFTPQPTMITVRGETVADSHGTSAARTQALFNTVKDSAKTIINLLPGTSDSLIRLVDKLEDPTYLTNLCAAYLNIPTPQKQELLEEVMVEKRMTTLLEFMQQEREVLLLQKDIQEKMSERLGKAQRHALLREQMKEIREELEEKDEETRDKIEEKIKTAELPEEVRKVVDIEIKRLQDLPQASAEYHVIRTYLDWIVDMPWKKSTTDIIDLAASREILDQDHYGMETVKKRILQYLAVAKLKKDLHGPIICLVGPPGVGKTSIGQSIARSLGRRFIRTSLGGIRDEAEIRGHRRTYIGAMPGRIVQSIKRAGVNNPLMLLDEIDKVGSGMHGDPAAALLEVLDPEQNKSFTDHYLDVPFDLSHTFFIATANVVDTIPPALLDRLEIIDVSSYTTAEKKKIARQYLLPKQMKEHGLNEEQLTISEETLERVIASYTREAGVRELQRKLASLCRTAAVHLVEKPNEVPVNIRDEHLFEALGPERYVAEVSQRSARAGVVTGLAWTPHGGDILFIESSSMPGSGKLTLTGQLGDVMKESAQIALSSARSEAAYLAPQFQFEKQDVHIHVPSGAIPKDGPSAGVTMITSIASLLTGRPVDPKLAMTGEITLRGAVLPVGGIREKVLAAHRAGIERIIMPERNRKDLHEVPEDVKTNLKFIFVTNVGEVLETALGLPLKIPGYFGHPPIEGIGAVA